MTAVWNFFLNSCEDLGWGRYSLVKRLIVKSLIVKMMKNYKQLEIDHIQEGFRESDYYLERTRAAAFQSKEWPRTNIRPSLGARESTFLDQNWKSKKISRSQSSQPEDSEVRSRQK